MLMSNQPALLYLGELSLRKSLDSRKEPQTDMLQNTQERTCHRGLCTIPQDAGGSVLAILMVASKQAASNIFVSTGEGSGTGSSMEGAPTGCFSLWTLPLDLHHKREVDNSLLCQLLEAKGPRTPTLCRDIFAYVNTGFRKLVSY